MIRSGAGARYTTAVLAAGALLLPGCGGDRSSDTTDRTIGEPTSPTVDLGEDEIEVSLFFPGDGWYLLPEPRAMTRWSSPLDGARAVLTEVLAGPESEALIAPLPDGVGLGEVHLTDDGRLYVDLLSTEHDRPPVEGSLAELLTVFSLVDSVLLNLPEIDSVVLLWNGRQPATFAGHVDTSLPLVADEDLLASRR
ncbi:MAG: GerMN domain-containing protein [Thermoanaerobaculia bacterium]|nr:GerMN domain-containing protein [Thermoanaerobaculia bacterium]